jgi:hypothetical protein
LNQCLHEPSYPDDSIITSRAQVVNMYVCMYGDVLCRHVVVSLFYGSLFYQLSGGVDPTAYSERLGVLFFTIIFMVMGKYGLYVCMFKTEVYVFMYVCMYVCMYICMNVFVFQ